MRILGISLLWVLATTAFAAHKTCATVVAESETAWTLVSFPSQLNVVYAYAPAPGRLTVVDAPYSPEKPLQLHHWDFASDRRRIPATTTLLHWDQKVDDPREYRPTLLSPQGNLAATILEKRGTKVALHAPDDFPNTEHALFFSLSPADRPMPLGIDSKNATKALAAAVQLPRGTALNLQFAPDGQHLLGFNATGVEVHHVVAKQRLQLQRGRTLDWLKYAGWLGNDQIVLVTEDSHVQVRALDGTLLSEEILPGGDGDVTAVTFRGRPQLLCHRDEKPFEFALRDPRTLGVTETLTIVGFGHRAALADMMLLPEGIALFRVEQDNRETLVAAHVLQALKETGPILRGQLRP